MDAPIDGKGGCSQPQGDETPDRRAAGQTCSQCDKHHHRGRRPCKRSDCVHDHLLFRVRSLMPMFSSSPDAVRFIVRVQTRSMIRTLEDMAGAPDRASLPADVRRERFLRLHSNRTRRSPSRFARPTWRPTRHASRIRRRPVRFELATARERVPAPWVNLAARERRSTIAARESFVGNGRTP